MKKLFNRVIQYAYDLVRNDISEMMEKKISLVMAMQNQQQVFSQFKNINNGKDVVIMATGPSVDYFVPIKDAVYIGVNRCALYDDVDFDYMFMQDYAAVHKYIEKMASPKFENTVKFYGIMPEGYWNEVYEHTACIPESIAIRHNAFRYYVPIQLSPAFQSIYPLDIGKQLFAIGDSVISSAFQFALYTNPRRIFLVGCDASHGHFGNDNYQSVGPDNVKYWKERKTFAETWYPETEIISINPVGLKGMFKDVYQENTDIGQGR